MSIMQEYQSTSALFGGNAPFIEEQYEIYLSNPGAVSADWRTYFDSLRDGAPGGGTRMRLKDLIAALQATYCHTFGAEYMYMADTTQKRFIQERLEPLRARPSYTPEFRKHILERLTAAETLERYLHTKYVGQ